MGWTSYHATHYKNGNIDRKAEMDERLTQSEHDGYPQLTVLKSTMVGSVYYGAVEIKRNNNVERVFGIVALTSTDNRDYYNFSYKDMDETMGPYETKCPMSIINLLSPTDNECAEQWRQKCKEYAQKKKEGVTLDKVPVGTRIKFTTWDNRTVELVKCAPAYQFKRNWWFNPASHTYCPSRRIPKNFEIV